MTKETTPNKSSKANFEETYSAFFRRDAHELLALGYKDVRSNINSGTKETDITIKIYEAICDRFDSFEGIPKYIRNRNYAVKAEDPSLKSGGLTRLDIVVEEPNGIPRARYIFEAKRLKKNGFAISKYCNKDGVKRFIAGRYALNYPEAAMIGFMQSDDANYWLKELKRILNNDEKDDFKIQEHLKPSQVITNFPYEWVSVHRRSSNTNITLFHIFLDCG